MCRSLLVGILVILTAYLPSSHAHADRGEGTLSLGVAGSLSFLRNPELEYGHRAPRLNATTLMVDLDVGMGVTDWLEVGWVGRFVLPAKATDGGASAQGFPEGRATYAFLALQTPLRATFRYNRGGATTLGIAIEAGVEWARWDLQAFSSPSLAGRAFGVESREDWSTSLMLGVQPMVEWRHFDHFAFKLGPRLLLSTTGTMHLGVFLGGTFLGGLGLF